MFLIYHAKDGMIQLLTRASKTHARKIIERSAAMLHLKDILAKRMRQSGISSKVSAAQIVVAAQEVLLEVFPEDLVTRMAAAHVQGESLTIKVESPMVGQEVKFHEMDILNKLLKKLPNCNVRRIRFSV